MESANLYSRGSRLHKSTMSARARVSSDFGVSNRKCYKPVSTRAPFLLTMVLFTLGLIALVEVACRRYPIDSSTEGLWGFNLSRRSAQLDPEVVVNHQTTAGIVPGTPEGANPTHYIPSEPSGILPGPGKDVSVADVGAGPLTHVPPDPTTTDPPVFFPTTIDPSQYIPTVIPSVSEPGGPDRSSSTPEKIPPPVTTTEHEAPSKYIPETPTDSASYYLPGTTGYIPDPGSEPSPKHGPVDIPTITTTSIRGAATVTSTPPGYAAPSDYITTNQDTSHTQSRFHMGLTTIYLLPSTAYIPEDNKPTSTATPVTPGNAPPGSYIPSTAPPATTTGKQGQASASTPTDRPTADASGHTHVPDTTIATHILVPVSTITTDGTVIVSLGTALDTASGVQTTTELVPVSTIVSNSVAVVVLGRPTSTSLIPISTITTGGVTSTIFGFATAITTSSASPTPTSISDLQHRVFPWTKMSYFIGSYLPTLVAVLFRILWSIVYSNARLMEPFYRLKSEAAGSDSLSVLYLSMGNLLPEPIRAMVTGHVYMFLVSITSALIDLLAPLSSELLLVDVKHGCIPAPNANPNHPCLPPRLVVHAYPARIIQGLLGLIVIAITLVAIVGWRRQSGVFANPSSIAAMASLLHHPDVVEDMKEMQCMSDGETESRLKRQTWKLDYYIDENTGAKHYGIVPGVRVMRSPGYGGTSLKNSSYRAVPNPEPENGSFGLRATRHRQGWRRHLWRTLGDISLLIFMVGLLGVTVAYYLDGNDDGFNRFFNSETFGPKFILVAGAGIVVMQWRRLEREVRTIQPYRTLYTHSDSTPNRTVLLNTTSTPYSTLPLSIYHLEPLVALTTFCYILSEILVIAISTVPFSSAQYYMAFLAGTYIVFGVLGLQILVFAAIILWWRRTGPVLDRDPDTLLGVWGLLSWSRCREDFAALGEARTEELEEVVKRWGKRYWIAETSGRDGPRTMGIDSDALGEDMEYESFRAQVLDSWNRRRDRGAASEGLIQHH